MCKRKLIKVAKQPRNTKFKHYRECLQELMSESLDFLNDMDKERWALSYDNGHRFGYMITNLS